MGIMSMRKSMVTIIEDSGSVRYGRIGVSGFTGFLGERLGRIG